MSSRWTYAQIKGTLKAYCGNFMFSSIQSIPIAPTFEVFEVLSPLSGLIVTISIWYFGRRMSPVQNFGLRMSLWFGLATAWLLAHPLLYVYNCQLGEYLRDRSRDDLHCAHAGMMEYSLAAVQMSSVFMMMLVPISWLANGHIKSRRKVSLLAACTLHTIIAYVAIFSGAFALQNLQPYRFSWIEYHFHRWVNVWGNMSLISVNLRDIRPLLREILPASLRARFPSLEPNDQEEMASGKFGDDLLLPVSDAKFVNDSTISPSQVE